MTLLVELVIIMTLTSLSHAVPAGKAYDQMPVMDLRLGSSAEGSKDFDHEAFLGQYTAHVYDKKTRKESEIILGTIFDKIDKNKDGKIDHADMAVWIKKVERRSSVISATHRLQRYFKTDKINHKEVTFKDHEEMTWGHMSEDEKQETGHVNNYKDHRMRDLRRWNAADRDSDGKLTLEEYTDFLHPGESDSVSRVVVAETLESMDANRDNVISLIEYIDHIFPDRSIVERSWITDERELFRNQRDLNGDGQLDKEEIRKWVLPGDHTVDVEVSHLISEADSNKDGVLTKTEMLEAQDFFIGSTATDFGDAILNHEEL